MIWVSIKQYGSGKCYDHFFLKVHTAGLLKARTGSTLVLNVDKTSKSTPTFCKYISFSVFSLNSTSDRLNVYRMIGTLTNFTSSLLSDNSNSVIL